MVFRALTSSFGRKATRSIYPGCQHQLRWASTKRQPTFPSKVENSATESDLGKFASEGFVDDITPFMVPTYARPTPVMVKGSGCYLWDMDGHQYLDLTAGIAVTSLGHSDPGVSRLLAEQSEILIHASNLFHNNHTGKLSQSLVTHTLASGAMRNASQAFICNSGTEANEAALKFARKVGHSLDKSGAKHEIVSFQGSFHGRTFGALSATPNPKYQAPFAPMVPGFKYGPYNNIEQLPTLITEKTCGVIVEPIQGEGGVNVATAEFLVALRARCDEVGAVLIFDEIQCGLSRTGSLWAHAHPAFAPQDGSKQAHPDILTTAKALGNGFPIGATLISHKVGEHIKVGDHGTTFGGSPLASAVGNSIFLRLANTDLQEDVIARSRTFVRCLSQLRAAYPNVISEVRGLGLILGIQLSGTYVDRVGEILAKARDKGLLIISAGEGCIRFVPPLIITSAEIETGMKILEEVIGDVVANSK
ncbi:acetylornithine aminotransferase [Myotisia sp. PD_48]|nr:acetylornithine aminotransferase [Myotisia sp. PD_48]